MYETFLFDDMAMAEAPNLAFQAASVTVVAPESPLAAGTSGTVRIYQREGIVGFGTPAEGASVVAVVPDQPELAALFAYDEGDTMLDQAAPARRLGLPYIDDATAVLTEEGQAMFDAAIRWLVHGIVEEPTPSPTPTPTPSPSPTSTRSPEPTTTTPGPEPSPTVPGADPGGRLPDTGAGSAGALGVAALTLLAAGAVLALRRRPLS